MLEEYLFFYWTTDDPDYPDKASPHPRRLDQTHMRSKNQLTQLNQRLKN